MLHFANIGPSPQGEGERIPGETGDVLKHRNRNEKLAYVCKRFTYYWLQTEAKTGQL
jgi:hypothetical protein